MDSMGNLDKEEEDNIPVMAQDEFTSMDFSNYNRLVFNLQSSMIE